MDLPTTAAIVALVYFSLATALFGESPAKWALLRTPVHPSCADSRLGGGRIGVAA
jgi:hypothetical protein